MTAQAAETGILSEAVVYAASFSNGRLTALHPAHRTRLLLQPALPVFKFDHRSHAFGHCCGYDLREVEVGTAF